MKENNRKSTFASTLRGTPILEKTPVSILGSYFGGFPISGQSAGSLGYEKEKDDDYDKDFLSEDVLHIMPCMIMVMVL